MTGAEKTYAHHMVRTDSREQKLDAFVKPVQSSSSPDRTTQPIRSDSAQPMETSTSDQTYVIITFLIGIYSSYLNKRPSAMSSDGVNIDKFLLYVYKIQYNCMSKSYEYSFKKNSVTLIFFLFHQNCLLLVQFYNKTKKQKPSQNMQSNFFSQMDRAGRGE